MQRWIERLMCAWLVGCFLAFVLMSWSWPLTGDASLMHYVVFLMHHGKEPYRDIIDMNLPASYMVGERRHVGTRSRILGLEAV